MLLAFSYSCACSSLGTPRAPGSGTRLAPSDDRDQHSAARLCRRAAAAARRRRRARLARFQDALKAEITDNAIAVIESGNQIILRLAAALFPPADARVKPTFVPLLQRLAGLLEKGTGRSRSWATRRDPDQDGPVPVEFRLSEARAKAVAAILKAGLSKPDRLATEGKGADVPIASNKTPEGRARNRRVDIVVPRER